MNAPQDHKAYKYVGTRPVRPDGEDKVTGKAMGAAVHSNVGLFHATMAIFNAWCDRMPIVILGATGPVDAMKRRPWIDWIHTAADQGAIIRNYTKWDDQPASAGAAREAVLRANWIANTIPQGPTYVNLDAEVQEGKLPAPLPPGQGPTFLVLGQMKSGTSTLFK